MCLSNAGLYKVVQVCAITSNIYLSRGFYIPLRFLLANLRLKYKRTAEFYFNSLIRSEFFFYVLTRKRKTSIVLINHILTVTRFLKNMA